LKQLTSIAVNSQYADAVNEDGETLIPPTLTEFANTFSSDIASSWTVKLPVKSGPNAIANSIFLTIGTDDGFKDAAGRFTSEAYKIDVTSSGITITGASPLGVWWGTRTILQQAVLGDMKIPVGSGVDAPGWANRGIMV
jgi:hexosaminidase